MAGFDPDAPGDDLTADLTVVHEPRPGVSRQPASRATPGTRVGRYLVIEESGRGGAGAVVRAYDPKLQREVALKLLHLGNMSEAARSGLVHEARAMAQLSHPNVVAVFDVESDEDFGVLLVMEYVPGMTLRAWLARRARAWPEIVETFVHAGHGLAAAHAVGLLHRDFKPTNVLVGDDGRVRVTDFGLARSRRRGEDLPSPSTSSDEGYARREFGGPADDASSGALVRGTPPYMAPEQHEGAKLGVATDQYALCVSLWEALTGALPFVGRMDELLQAKKAGPPPWPSQATAPRAVIQAVRRGLAADPSQRWPSLDALLRTLAQASHRRARTRRVAATAGGVAIAGALAWQLWPSTQAPCSGAPERLAEVWSPAHAEQTKAALIATGLGYAETTAARVTAALDDYGAQWIAMHTSACEATAVLREQSAEALDLRMTCLDSARRELGAAVGVLRSADEAVLQNADRLVESLAPLEHCADVEALQAAVVPPRADQAEAVERGRAQLAEARATQAAGKADDAAAVIDAATPEITAIDYPPLQVELWAARASVRAAQARWEDAAADHRRVLQAAPRLGQWDLATVATIGLTTVVGVSLARPEAGLAYAELALGLAVLTGDPELRTLELRAAMASVWSAQAKFVEAEAEHRAVVAALVERYGADHPEVARARSRVVGALYSQGKYLEAEQEDRAALAAQVRLLGPEHPVVATTRSTLAVILVAQGRYPEAEAEHLEVLALRLRVLGPGHLQITDSRENLAQVLYAEGKNLEAERQLRLALAARIASLGEDHPQVASIRNNLIGPLVAANKLDEAETMARAALATWERALGPEHPDVAMARSNLAVLQLDRGDPKGAEATIRAALPGWERALGPEHPDVLHGRVTLANTLEQQGRLDESERELRAAIAGLVRSDAPDTPFLAACHTDLARVLELQRRMPAAQAEWRAAIEIMTRRFGADHPDLARARKGLAGNLRATGGDRREARALDAAADAVLEAEAAAGR